MEFNEKLQALRRQSGMTQEQLANRLYVSRTAVSKWESGRGYPNIESLRAIAKVFSVTLDELLSTDEILELAKEQEKERTGRLTDLICGLLDISSALLFFMPFFASRSGDAVIASSLLELRGIQPYLKVLYFVFVTGIVIYGIATLALQGSPSRFWQKSKGVISLCLGGIGMLLFILSLQPYAAVFLFVLLAIKTVFLIKKQ